MKYVTTGNEFISIPESRADWNELRERFPGLLSYQRLHEAMRECVGCRQMYLPRHGHKCLESRISRLYSSADR
jgi:hypothetical protein